MNTSKSVPLAGTIPRFVHNLVPRIPRRRLLAVYAFLLIFIILLLALVVRQSDPINDLESAKARWNATGISDYRITIEFQRPYSSCQLDFEVRGTNIGYKHKDSCNIGPVTGKPKPDTNWPTVANLFAQIENVQKNQECGSNGCVCDGPIDLDVTYDPERGYPQKLAYALNQNSRPHDPLSLLNGSLANCPQVTYIGQTIHITKLEALPPLVEQLSESTPEVGVGKPDKEQTGSETSIGGAIKPEVTPSH
ncbi:MAG: hypothetical protein H0X30_29230 [Anaerolineae bacterium]|nr:hypothetical protein [Anaerolineae bacterium]